jgi:hypothetical protein
MFCGSKEVERVKAEKRFFDTPVGQGGTLVPHSYSFWKRCSEI